MIKKLEDYFGLDMPMLIITILGIGAIGLCIYYATMAIFPTYYLF